MNPNAKSGDSADQSGLYEFSRRLAAAPPRPSGVWQAVNATDPAFFGNGVLFFAHDRGGDGLRLTAARHVDPLLDSAFQSKIGSLLDWPDQLPHQSSAADECIRLSPGATRGILQSIDLARAFDEREPPVGMAFLLHAHDKLFGFFLALQSPTDSSEAAHVPLRDFSNRAAMALVAADWVESLTAELNQREEVEQELHDSEELFRTIFQASALGIKVLDPDGRILRCNPALQRILRRGREEIVGKHFSAFTHPHDLEKNITSFNRLVDGAVQTLRLSKRYIDPDGDIIWASLTFTLVRNQEGEPRFVIGIVDDITQRKRLADELTEMRGMLLESAENERLRLAQNLHDGPVQDLHSITYLLEHQKTADEPIAPKDLDEVQRQVQSVIDQLRNTAHELRPPTLLDFGLEQAIRSHTATFAEHYKDLTIHLELAKDRKILPERVRVALFRIYQHALMNVVRHAEADNAWIRFRLDAESAELVVEDDGRGFDVPDNWLAAVRGGHFGLAGATERAQALGGTLEIESEAGKGTTVSVRISNSGWAA